MRLWVRENRGFVLFLLLFGVFRTAVADWNPIPSGSMHPGLLEGDVVFVNRLAYNVKIPLTDLVLARTGEPRRGDIVTFSSPAEARRLVINGQPGQYRLDGRVDETDAAGRPWVGLTVQEAFDSGRHEIEWAQDRRSAADFGPIRIPADHYLMLGDNRDNSADSRFFGLVSRERLIGRAERILVSAAILDHWQPRLSRFWASLQ
jgi:signal peptidase I